MEETYEVIAFRQQAESPIQVAFVAHAGEILSWAGIPRKSDELLTGYQRFLDEKRVDVQILPFFQTPENCSPTAVIVALRKDSTLGRCELANESIAPGQIVNTTLTISLDEATLQTDELFETALRYVNGRLAQEEPDPQGTANEDEECEVEEEGEETSEDETLAHLGLSLIHI